jgi:hypothetical protein
VAERSHGAHGGAGKQGEDSGASYPDEFEFGPGGLSVVWAEENSRDAIFAAMQRREAYGTRGPRLALRFFGGWDYAADLCAKPDLVAKAYAGGVPMGDDLPVRPRPGMPECRASWSRRSRTRAARPRRSSASRS